MAVQAQKGHHGYERGALISIAEGVRLRDAERVRRRERRDIRLGIVAPFLSRSRKRRLERVLIPHAWKSAVFAKLVEMRGIHDEPRNPNWLTHDLLRELAKRVAILFRGIRGDRQSLFDVRIVRRQ